MTLAMFSDMIPKEWFVYLPLLTDLIRKILAIAGGCGFTWGLTVTGSQVEMAAGAALALISVCWGFYQKIRAQHALRVAAANDAGMTPPKLPL